MKRVRIDGDQSPAPQQSRRGTVGQALDALSAAEDVRVQRAMAELVAGMDVRGYERAVLTTFDAAADDAAQLWLAVALARVGQEVGLEELFARWRHDIDRTVLLDVYPTPEALAARLRTVLPLDPVATPLLEHHARTFEGTWLGSLAMMLLGRPVPPEEKAPSPKQPSSPSGQKKAPLGFRPDPDQETTPAQPHAREEFGPGEFTKLFRPTEAVPDNIETGGGASLGIGFSPGGNAAAEPESVPEGTGAAEAIRPAGPAIRDAIASGDTTRIRVTSNDARRWLERNPEHESHGEVLAALRELDDLVGGTDAAEFLEESTPDLSSPAPDSPVDAEPESAPPPQSGRSPESGPPEPEPVLLGGSAPRRAPPGDTVLIQFAAYVAAFEPKAEQALLRNATQDEVRLGQETDCRWPTGVRVSVRCRADGLDVSEPVQQFTWNGQSRTVQFDARIPEDARPRRTVIVLEAWVHDTSEAEDAVQVAGLRMPLEIAAGVDASTEPVQTVRASAARTAFASYASEDRVDVLERVSSIRRSTGMDIFVDVVGLRVGDQWNPELEKHIRGSDRFLLFWSEHTPKSRWVTWEREEAVKARGEDVLELHLLRFTPIDQVPADLRKYHFNDIYIIARDAELHRRAQAAAAAGAPTPGA